MNSSNTEVLQLAVRLRSISRDDGSIDAAQVRVIGLDEIREAAGRNWPRMRERVRNGSMEILSRYTGSEDVIVPAGDGFLVILAPGAPGNNQERCNKMREALLSFYLGEEALNSLRATVTARSLTTDGFADLMSSGLRGEYDDPQASTSTPTHEITIAPVYSTRLGKVVAHSICPVRGERGERRLAYNPDYILDGAHHDRTYFLIDEAVLDQAFLAPGTVRQAPSTGFTVHATTLHNRRSRDVYLSLLAQAAGERLRDSIITIAEIEKGTPLISIEEWCHCLRSFVSRVCLDFHYTDHALSSIGGSGAWAAGFHLPIYSGAQCGPRASRTLDQLRFWSKAVHNQGMRLAVNGFKDLAFLKEASEAGVDLATSNALWPFATSVPDTAPPQRAMASA